MAESLYKKILCNKIRNEENAIRTIEKCGVKILKGSILAGKKGTDSFRFILKSFQGKL